jgi:hypothetical protein
VERGFIVKTTPAVRMWLRNVAGTALVNAQGSDCENAVRCSKTVNGLSGDNVVVVTNNKISQVSLCESSARATGAFELWTFWADMLLSRKTSVVRPFVQWVDPCWEGTVEEMVRRRCETR